MDPGVECISKETARANCKQANSKLGPNISNLPPNKTFFNGNLNISNNIALWCYPNVNGSVGNLSLNTSTAPIFL